VNFGARSEQELRKVESPWPGCPGHPGHGSPLVIIEYQDVHEVQSHEARGTRASKLLCMTLCNMNKWWSDRDGVWNMCAITTPSRVCK